MKKILNLIVIAMLLLSAGCLTTAPASDAGSSEVMAQGPVEDGFVRLHYQRPEADYEGWGLHLWGAGYAGDTVDWTAAVEPTGMDDFGAYWDIPYFGEDELNFIIHNGDMKDPDGDRTFEGVETINEFWAISGSSDLFLSAEEAL